MDNTRTVIYLEAEPWADEWWDHKNEAKDAAERAHGRYTSDSDPRCIDSLNGEIVETENGKQYFVYRIQCS